MLVSFPFFFSRVIRWIYFVFLIPFLSVCLSILLIFKYLNIVLILYFIFTCFPLRKLWDYFYNQYVIFTYFLTHDAITLFHKVTARDDDPLGSTFANVTYGLIGDDSMPTFFSLNSITGDILVRRALTTDSATIYIVGFHVLFFILFFL